MHELSHNHSRNPRHTHPFLYVGPYGNTCNKFEPFPDIFNTTEIFSSGFFLFNLLDQIMLVPISTPKNQNQTTLFSPLYKSNHLTYILSRHNPLPSFSPPHLIFLRPQNPLINLLRKILCIDVLKHFHWAIEITFHFNNSLFHDL
jgi:hypothetical protein